MASITPTHATTSPFGVPSLSIDVSQSPALCHFHLNLLKELPKGGEGLPAAMCLALARGNQKYLNNKKPRVLSQLQHTHHFYAISKFGTAWVCSIIFADAIHVQTPLFSNKHIPHGSLPASDLSLVDKTRLQLDHLTGEWVGAGVGNLHLTSVRDFSVQFQDSKAKYIKEAQILDELKSGDPVMAGPKSCPQHFFSLRFNESIMRKCIELTKNRKIGSCGEDVRSKLCFPVNLPQNETLADTVEALNNNLHNTHHTIDLTKQPNSWPTNCGFELICRTGFIGDCLDNPTMQADEECLCEELTYLDAHGDSYSRMKLTNVNTSTIPMDRYVTIDHVFSSLKAVYYPPAQMDSFVALNEDRRVVFILE